MLKLVHFSRADATDPACEYIIIPLLFDSAGRSAVRLNCPTIRVPRPWKSRDTISPWACHGVPSPRPHQNITGTDTVPLKMSRRGPTPRRHPGWVLTSQKEPRRIRGDANWPPAGGGAEGCGQGPAESWNVLDLPDTCCQRTTTATTWYAIGRLYEGHRSAVRTMVERRSIY